VDADYIARHPKLQESLRLDLLPCPYQGRPDARVYLLLLNPGARHEDFEHGSEFVEERRRALRFESAHCFWPLAPGLEKTEAYEYAEARMRALIGVVGLERVAQRMMWLQYLGYQSLRVAAGVGTWEPTTSRRSSKHSATDSKQRSLGSQGLQPTIASSHAAGCWMLVGQSRDRTSPSGSDLTAQTRSSARAAWSAILRRGIAGCAIR
jgi:hypothetical protein